MAKRTRAEQRSRAAWWDRTPWPCAVLGIDPGALAGATLGCPNYRAQPADVRIIWHRAIDSATRELERAVRDAACFAKENELQLVLVLEDWGRGGPLGIDTWLGLGAARGHWERAARLILDEMEGCPIRRTKPWVRVGQTAWRSRMIESWGTSVIAPGGGSIFTPHDPAGWKLAARDAVKEILGIDAVSDDEAESILIAFYAMRSDEVGKALPKRLLRAHGFAAP
jgi:hypothetical protein